ncbi:MAG: tetratricopeptide repeat protein [Planctomycetota bacterium]
MPTVQPANLLLPLACLLTPAATTFAAPAAAGSAWNRQAEDGDEQYRLLAGLADKDMHEMVVREGEAFLRRFSDHPKRDLARYRLATSLFELERISDALPHFRELVRLRGFEYGPESWFRLGQCQLDAGQAEAAAASFAKVIESGKEYLQEHALFLRADAAFRMEDFPAAERGYAEVLERGRKGEYARDASSGLAWCAWKRGDLSQAVQRIERHLGRYEAGGDDPYSAELRVLLGEAHLQTGAPQRALEAFRGVQSPAQADAAQRGIAFALADLGDHAGAARVFGELLERSPEGPFAAEAALHRGIHLLRDGRPEDAARALNAPAAGGGPEVLYWRAQAQSQAGDARAALASLEQALKRSPDDELRARIQMARGDALSALGRDDDAIAAYGAAGSAYSLHAAAVAALNGGDAAEAIRIGEELLSRFPGSEYEERTRVVLGEAHFARGDYGAAERTLEGLPTGAQDAGLRARAQSRVAWCRYLQGDTEAAAREFARLVRDHGDAPEAEEALYMEGRAREEAGDNAGSVRAWNTYVSRYAAGANRAEALVGLGRLTPLADAAKHIERLLNEAPESALLPQALYELGERASAAGQLPTAKASYEALLAHSEAGPLASPGRYGLAWCLVQEENYAEAAALLDSIRADFGASDELRTSGTELLVWVWRRAGEPQKSAQAWQALARLTDDEQRLFQAAKTAALALRDAGDPRAAQKLLNQLLEEIRSPELAVEALVEGAYLALEADDVDRAEAQVKVAERRAPGHPKLAEASFFVGEARLESGEDARAIQLYEAACAPGSPVMDLALYKRGFAELRREKPKAAEAALAQLVADHGESDLWGEGLFLLGEARFRLDRFEQAAEDLERLRRERPRHEVLPKALFRLGLCYAQLERWDPCDRTLSALLKDNPRFENLAEAELARGTALVALERPRAARQALGRVLSLDGESVLAARAHLQLGRLARGEGDLDEALSEFLKVAVLFAADEEVAEALYRAGACLEEQGKQNTARERYREAADKYGKTAFGGRARARLSELERNAQR